MTKQSLKYKEGRVTFWFGVRKADILLAEDHPLGYQAGEWIKTSEVLDHDEESGRIETANTIYLKETP